MKKGRISNNVIRRLPMYLRKLDDLIYHNVDRISSNELGKQMGLTPSQIRQDFSCFGEFGQQGYGYRVPELREQVARILG
ncbi:MAG: redox-sensing transcriptional repressor Rex, partial [Clostridiales bacterium]|nr:redox-sensing transcriptional repressor Rex [Clostridiales bacterium]